MLRQIKDFTLRAVAGANAATILLMLLVGYSDRADPSAHGLVAVAGLLLPLLIAANAAFTVFWLCVRATWALLPLAGFVAAYGPVTTYCPVNVRRPAPQGAIKVLSYNVYNFGQWDPAHPEPRIAAYVARQDADIACLIEAGADPWKQKQLDSIMAPAYKYADTTSLHGGDVIRVYSKFPILRHEHIPYVSDSNHSSAFWIDMGSDTTLLIANHFERTGLSYGDRSNFKAMVKGDMERDSARAESRLIFRKLAAASARRAPQARAVARFIDRHRGRSIILCGDFNDSPISYCRRTIASRLTDCYADTGNGPGISYHKGGFYVRIDNIFCSSHWTPYGCTVDRSISESDHYPIYCWLRRRGQTGAAGVHGTPHGKQND